jgi:hypothetical protein
MLTAVEYIGPIGFGATSPQIFRGDDGNLYVVKFQNNRLGPKVLVNEYLSYWYAGQLNLCFPPGDLISISPQLLQRSKRLKAARISESPHFASLYLSHCRYVGRFEFAKAINKKAMAGVLLFDHMFHNVDRTKNRRNLLLRHEKEGYVLYAIDNSHLFVRGRWTVRWLESMENRVIINRRRAYGWLIKHFLSVDDFYPYIEKVKNINDEQLREFVDSIPETWLPDKQERNALLRFMHIRREKVGDIAWRICKSIPDIHRRTNTD